MAFNLSNMFFSRSSLADQQPSGCTYYSDDAFSTILSSGYFGTCFGVDENLVLPGDVITIFSSEDNTQKKFNILELDPVKLSSVSSISTVYTQNITCSGCVSTTIPILLYRDNFSTLVNFSVPGDFEFTASSSGSLIFSTFTVPPFFTPQYYPYAVFLFCKINGIGSFLLLNLTDTAPYLTCSTTFSAGDHVVFSNWLSGYSCVS